MRWSWGGGSGLRAALQLSTAGLKTAGAEKVFPTRSHTVAAQRWRRRVARQHGRGQLALAHVRHRQRLRLAWGPGHIEFMCHHRAEAVIGFEHYGMPFDRNDDGTIYQRPFGGHSMNFGEKPVQRSCCAADRTGHAICTRCTSATCMPTRSSSLNGWHWTSFAMLKALWWA